MPWDIRNPFAAMATEENVVLLYLSYKYIFKYWKESYRNKYLKFLILFYPFMVIFVCHYRRAVQTPGTSGDVDIDRYGDGNESATDGEERGSG